MASFVDTTVKEIDERLRELKQEATRLEAARAALVGRASSHSRSTSRQRSVPTGQRAGRRKTRAMQALELVRRRPGITIPEIAAAIKIEPNYLYRVLPRLQEQGLVRKDDKGWHPA